jgi:predicted enzyme related to lactoylglutathione lyase
VKRIVELGGSIALAKMPIPGVGWLAYGKDTEGNIFGCMQSDPAAA